MQTEAHSLEVCSTVDFHEVLFGAEQDLWLKPWGDAERALLCGQGGGGGKHQRKVSTQEGGHNLQAKSRHPSVLQMYAERSEQQSTPALPGGGHRPMIGLVVRLALTDRARLWRRVGTGRGVTEEQVVHSSLT